MIDFKSFHKLSYGIYVICSEFEGKKSGYIGNTGFQITSSPSTMAISCNKENYTCQIIKKSKLFSLSVLQKDLNIAIIGDFGFRSSRELDKFALHKYKIGTTGIPVITDFTIATFECKVINEIDCGTHIVFFGEVIESEKLSDLPPLTYEYYHSHYKMLAPKNAPTYIDPEKLKEETKEKIEVKTTYSEYTCTICGYTYNPELGEPSHEILPGTPFEDIPEDFECPICKAGKYYFKEV